MDRPDLWYYSSFEKSWRMVATYKSTDANPKERFARHQAGAGGDRGSSYIKPVAFQEEDTDGSWTDASNGSHEQRLHYCQNPHADVGALVTDAAARREMARYPVYGGVPIVLPVGDTNSDGVCDQADQKQVRDWALATPAVYDVRGDLDLDGDVDLTDRATLRHNHKGITLWRTKLSAVGNVRGRAGYLAAGPDSTGYLIRHRAFPSACGVWASRDPLGYVDGASLLRFCQSGSSTRTDLDGTDSSYFVAFDTEVLACDGLSTYRLPADGEAHDLPESMTVKKQPAPGEAVVYPRKALLDSFKDQVEAECCPNEKQQCSDGEFNVYNDLESIKNKVGQFKLSVDKPKECVAGRCPAADAIDSQTRIAISTQ